MRWMPHSLIADQLWRCDRTAVNQEETALQGLDSLMDTASKCPRSSITKDPPRIVIQD